MCEKSQRCEKKKLPFWIIRFTLTIRHPSALVFIISIARHNSKIITDHKNLNILFARNMNANKQNIHEHTFTPTIISSVGNMEAARGEKEPPQEEAVVKLPTMATYASKSVKILLHFHFSGKNLASSKNSKVQQNLWLAIRILIISSGNDSATEQKKRKRVIQSETQFQHLLKRFGVCLWNFFQWVIHSPMRPKHHW